MAGELFYSEDCDDYGLSEKDYLCLEFSSVLIIKDTIDELDSYLDGKKIEGRSTGYKNKQEVPSYLAKYIRRAMKNRGFENAIFSSQQNSSRKITIVRRHPVLGPRQKSKVPSLKERKERQELVKRVRWLLRWSQGKLEYALGLTRKQVSSWELGSCIVPDYALSWFEFASILIDLRDNQILPHVPIGPDELVEGMDPLESFLYKEGFGAMRYFFKRFTALLFSNEEKEPIEETTHKNCSLCNTFDMLYDICYNCEAFKG